MKMKSASSASLALVLTVSCVTGCASIDRTSPQPVSTEPMPYDPALVLRTWDASTAYYANGDTLSAPSGFNYSPETARPNWQYYLIDTGIFALNVVTLPYTLATSLPLAEDQVNQGVVLEPSFHAMPPLPASPVDVEEQSATMPTAAPDELPTTAPTTTSIE